MKKVIFIVLLIVATAFGCLTVCANELGMERTEEEYHGAGRGISIAADSKGNVALYFDDDAINIYHPDGTFFYGLRLDVDSYVCDFDPEDNLIVFAARTDYIYYFNSKGECVKQVAKEDIPEYIIPDQYYRERMNLREIKEDGFEYILESSYSKTKLIQRMDDGSERILYETEGSTVIGKSIFGGTVAIVFISLFGMGIFNVYRFYKNTRYPNESNGTSSGASTPTNQS